MARDGRHGAFKPQHRMPVADITDDVCVSVCLRLSLLIIDHVVWCKLFVAV